MAHSLTGEVSASPPPAGIGPIRELYSPPLPRRYSSPTRHPPPPAGIGLAPWAVRAPRLHHPSSHLAFTPHPHTLRRRAPCRGCRQKALRQLLPYLHLSRSPPPPPPVANPSPFAHPQTEGSLSWLLTKGFTPALATSVTASNAYSMSDASIFAVSISLTPEGMGRYEEVRVCGGERGGGGQKGEEAGGG